MPPRSAERSRPNVILLMADQLAASALPSYGNGIVKAPHLAELGARSVVFETAYCNSPIYAPSRFSLLSGRLPTSIRAFDNAAEFPASIPTLAHYLCALGYRTILSGKKNSRLTALQRHFCFQRGLSPTSCGLRRLMASRHLSNVGRFPPL